MSLLAAEPWRALFDFCSHHLSQPRIYEGDGHPVIVYPGLGAGALHTSQLRTYLRNCNLDVHDWGGGVNRGPDGDFTDWLGTLELRVRELHAQHGRRVSLVGWSLGGIYARELAKRCPEAVRQVVTLATPFAAVDAANHAGTIYKMLGGSMILTPALKQQFLERPPVPSTSIFSRTDGLVCWRGCLQQPAVNAENVHVDASHLGMATHPTAMQVVADRLAQSEGRWRPYRRGRAAVKAPATGSSRSRK